MSREEFLVGALTQQLTLHAVCPEIKWSSKYRVRMFSVIVARTVNFICITTKQQSGNEVSPEEDFGKRAFRSLVV
jgi:hypothetical protein